ncbi:MAG TPA: LysR family transcriptional regulator [Verrucomicrobiales bacterium]|nr:LysR family transcriptional regulator [Verrucomicrobiales bacterium]
MAIFDDLALLRTFVAIVESGSISAGARRLKIPQPTLSRHLRALEEQCGAALLQRDTHRMSLTESGHRLLEDAQNILNLTDEAEDRFHADRMELSGRLRVFTTIDSGQTLSTRLLAEFLKANPKVTAELAFTNRPMQFIREGCDAGIVAGRLTDEGVVARPAGSIRQYLAASPPLVERNSRARSPGDLESWPWVELSGIQFREQNRVTLYDSKGKEHVLSISPVLLSEGVTSIREAVLAGLGVALLPDWLIREDIRSGRLLRVLPRWKAKDMPMHVVYPSRRALPLRVRAFVDFAADYYKKALQQSE